MRCGDEVLNSLKNDPSDQLAWAELYDLLEPRLRGFVYDLAKSWRVNLAEVDDVIQTVLARFVHQFRQNHHQFSSFEHLRSYLFKACRNGLIDQLRTAGRRTTANEVIKLRFEDLAAQRFMEAFRKAENTHLVTQLVARLQPGCQNLISRYLLSQQTLAEYAKEHKINPNTAYSQWHRCIAELRKILDERARKGPDRA